MTASARGGSGAGTDRHALKVADLAGRLTERDRQLCRLLLEHRVLTSHQLTQLAFNHLDTAEDRLRTLTALGVLDRFRPRRDTGSAPYHYVLGPLGAAVLAAEQSATVADLGYRRATTLAVANSRCLPEILDVNGFFTALAGYARHHPNTDLALWLSQQRCHAAWGRLIQPHGFGRWRDHDTVLEFFLQYRSDHQPISTLIAALAGYDDLAQATPQLATNLLVWLSSTKRETELHRTVPPRSYLVATATPSEGTTPPTPSGAPSAALGRGDAWSISTTSTTRHRIGHELCPSSTASRVLEDRWAIETTGWIAAAEDQGVPTKGSGSGALHGKRAACIANTCLTGMA